MLTRVSPLIRRLGVRSISGSEVATFGTSVGSVLTTTGAAIGGFYLLDSKIETKTNHLEQKLDNLAQNVNNIAISVAKIEEHTRKN
jgi:hypothetical protein